MNQTYPVRKFTLIDNCETEEINGALAVRRDEEGLPILKDDADFGWLGLEFIEQMQVIDPETSQASIISLLKYSICWQKRFYPGGGLYSPEEVVFLGLDWGPLAEPDDFDDEEDQYQEGNEA